MCSFVKRVQRIVSSGVGRIKNLQKNLTFNQYRLADVFFMTALCCVFEVVVTLAATKWFPEQPYSVSLVYAFIALVAMRWDGYAALPATLGGIAHCLAAGDDAKGFVVVLVGNLCCLLVLVLHKLMGKQTIRDNAWFTVLYVAAIYLFVSAGRFAMQLCFAVSCVDALRAVLYDMLSLVFALVIILICRKQNGLFEDQKTYLIREEERRNKQKQ